MGDPVKEAITKLPPRAQGALLLAIGLALNVLNVVMIVGTYSYFVVSLLVGPALMLLGLWRTAVGHPIDPYTGRLAKWCKVGIVLSAAIGLLISLAGFVLLEG
jgi:hypothetical protein